MKKIPFYITISLSSLLALSCSQLKKHPKKNFRGNNNHSHINSIDGVNTTASLTKSENSEYTHELAEANADDNEMTQELGADQLDDELPGSESQFTPYSQNFLKYRKTKRMEYWVEYFTKKNRDRFQRFINNGEEYRHHIEKVFQHYGLPKELYYVGLIESGYYLGARSHASAVGPWQFIKSTGQRYGMKITHELDERQDLFKATHAAAQYFKDLHNIFSSWELALAAYNSGENGMMRRIMKHGTRDFYELSRHKNLPSETINYVPKVLAAMHVINNAKEYGFEIPQKKKHLFDDTALIPVQKKLSLHTLSKKLKVDFALLKKLNPELKKLSTPTYFAGPYFLRVPDAKYAYVLSDEVKQRDFLSSSSSSKKITHHVVRRGETLLSISKKYKITPRSLANFNHFKSWKTRVDVGQKISLTEQDVEQKITHQQASTPRVKITNRPIVYKVAEGDNLTDIARLFNSPLSMLKKVNKIKREKILVGQKLVLPNTQKAIYTVRNGDHLTKVAKDFNLPIETLIKINVLKRRTIYPGQKIIVNID